MRTELDECADAAHRQEDRRCASTPALERRRDAVLTAIVIAMNAALRDMPDLARNSAAYKRLVALTHSLSRTVLREPKE